MSTSTKIKTTFFYFVVMISAGTVQLNPNLRLLNLYKGIWPALNLKIKVFHFQIKKKGSAYMKQFFLHCRCYIKIS
jgi:hypothetical protein